jgi:FkbM family methyltransferase
MTAPSTHHDVDSVQENRTYIFYFVNDAPYNVLPPEAKHQDPRAILLDIKRGVFPAPTCTAKSPDTIATSRHVIELIRQWFCDRDTAFAIFDVGSHAGLFAVEIGNYVRYCGKRTPIIAFEPGHTCGLIRKSVALNGLGSLVDVREVALTDVDGLLLFGEADVTTSVSSLWRKSYHDRTTVIESVSLESALKWVAGIDHVIMKLDVEGAEPLVLPEIARSGPRYKFITICEVVPWRFNGWPVAASFVKALNSRYHLVNIHTFLHNYTLTIMDDDDITPLMQDVANRPMGFTDFLLIPRDLQNAHGLLARTAQLKPSI